MILDARQISFTYGSRAALREVDVQLAAGKVLALIGPNGSGKTTLIRVLIGALRASRGAIQWEGRPIGSWDRRRLARMIAYLAQTPLFEPQQTVLEVLRLGRTPYLGLFGIESFRDGRIIEEVSARLVLEQILHRPMDELSGGQRQRVFIARALVQEPRVILLDEPGTYLDLRYQVELMAMLRDLARQQGVAILMASHDLNLAASAADELMLLDQGQVAARGSPDRVLDPALLARIYGVNMRRIESAGQSPLVVPVL